MSPRRFAAACLALVGIIHLILTPDQLEEKTYVGVLFVVGGLAAIAAAVRLWQRDDPLAWSVGALASLGMGIGFILSRTVGLPGFKEEEWELSGIVCLLLEAGFLAAWAVTRSRAEPQPSTA